MTQIKLRRDTAANFTSKNPVLGIGEPAYETDTKKLKIGDGTTAYTQLEYFSAGGGGSTNISATLPLKIVDGVISLEVDGQTIQIVDGKLTASSTAPTNMVTTDTSQDITGKKSFTTGKITFKNTDSNRKILGEINGNGFYCNYYTDKASGEKPCYLGKVGRDTFNMGIPDLTGVNGRIFARTLTKWDGISEVGTILDSSNLGSYVDGTTITYTNNKLSATGGSSGLEVCDIGMALYVDETKGLRRYLNGQIVDINTNSQEFLNRLKEITTLHPSLLCTEEEWQTAKTMSAFGQVGKFVFNYSGGEIVSVRLPRVVNVQGLFDLQNLGMTVAESLPNIKGGYTTNADISGDISETTGAFNGTSITTTSNYGGGSGRLHDAKVVFNAHNSSPTYQDDAPVQQEAIQYPYFIQIATGSETEVNIKDTLDLNNPFTFGMNMYFKGEMANISWLKSAGQQNPKALYPDFYNWVLTNANAGKDGFKLSTASDITDYDFVVNTTDETFRLPLKNGLEGMFASGVKGNGMTLGLQGYNNQNVVSTMGVVMSSTTGLTTRSDKYGVEANKYENINGDSIQYGCVSITTDASKSGMVVDTTAPTGYNLYYYVGVVVNNEGLINAGRIGEVLANKQDKCIHIIDTYVNGTSWYRIWSDGWCEQGGKHTATANANTTITLIKQFNNTDYNLLLTGTYEKAGGQYSVQEQSRNSRTTSSFVVKIGGYSNSQDSCYWFACGYLAEGQY